MSACILHVLDHSLPLHSGYAFRTDAIRREQQRLGWQTHWLTTPRQGQVAGLCDEAGGLPWLRTPAAVKGNVARQMMATTRRIGNLVAALRPDVLHAHSPILNAIPALWVGRRHRLPVVYEMRSSWEDAAVDHGWTVTDSPRYRASRALETMVLRQADAVVTICEGLREEIIARGVAPDRITVVPNAVDADRFPVSLAPDPGLRARLGLNGCTVLGFAGSFYRYEGLALLLESMRDLTESQPRLRLLLVGGGPEESALRQQLSLLGLSDRVVLTGRVDQSRVQQYYALIDLLVYPRLPTRLTDMVTPLKPLEAMAQGRLVLASDVGGHRELIRDRYNGFLFRAGSRVDLGQAITRLIESRAQWPDVIATARRYVAHERTWARSVDGYREAYRRITRSRAALAGLA